MPFFRAAAGQWSFVPRAVRFWNDHLESLLVKFKAEVKKLFLEALFFLIFNEV